jgi:RNA 3'-terminal phosphate cyclase
VDVRQGRSAGAGVFLCAKYANTVLSGDSLGEKGIPSEKVADMAVDALQKEMWSEATLDVHAADQLLPYMVLAEGPSRFRVREMTGHLQSQIDLILKFFDARIEAEGKEGSVLVQVKPTRT